MGAIKPVVQDGFQLRQVAQGDVLAGGETINSSLTTAGDGTILAAQLTAGILSRTGPGGAYTDTTDSAANIISALTGNVYIGTAVTEGGQSSGGSIENGTTFRLTYINTVAFAMTLAAGTGVTLGSNVNVAASSVKDYLITITNGTPRHIFTGNTTNGSAVITGMSQSATNQVSVGQVVTGTGIAANSTVISIQPGVGVTLNNNATATGSLVALTFSPTVRIDSLGQKLL